MPDLTTEQVSALDSARYLAECGVPIFLANPRPGASGGGSGFIFPKGWQNTEADPAVLDDWTPGMAVCAVMGRVVDGVDLDPRHGGDLPAEYTPRSYGRQRTPSGGTHDLVALLGSQSSNGILPGVDVKAGKPDGDGRGFLFIAPTVRESHETGEPTPYTWEIQPDLDELLMIGGDSSGRALAELITGNGVDKSPVQRSYSGPQFADLSPGQQKMAATYQEERLEYWSDQLQDAELWEEGRRDHKGRGWEGLTRDFAWALASYAVAGWMPITEAEAEEAYAEMLPPALQNDPKCKGKWHDGLLQRVAEYPVDPPPWSEFENTVDQVISESFNLPMSIDEPGVAEWMVETGLGIHLIHSAGLGWLVWDGRRWKPTRHEMIRNRITHAVKMMNHRAQDVGMDKDTMKKLSQFKTESKTRALAALVKDRVARDDSDCRFDARADLLNVANGVVDLRTGRLLAHSPEYMFTKITETDYTPGKRSADFDQVLTALDPEVRDWMHLRFGQAATGYMTSDDVMPIGVGGGSNGKTTLITVMRNAMGDFQVTVPNKLILGNPGDHPTEQTLLMGARMAFIDETPEGRNLNIGLVKTLLGTSEMSARKIAKDTISWKSSHSMFLMTNHLPRVAENDHGTTRRLALVRFDHKFPRDDAFRARVIEHDSEVTAAALAWIVEGARRWYAAGRVIPSAPAKVRNDTDEWLEESDPTNEYIEDRFVLDPTSAVLVKEINEDLNLWLATHAMRTWSSTLTASRLAQSASFHRHGLKPARADKTRALLASLDVKTGVDIPAKPVVYRGIRWRKSEEPMGFDPLDVATPEFAEEAAL